MLGVENLSWFSFLVHQFKCLLGFRDNQPPNEGASTVRPPTRQDSKPSLHTPSLFPGRSMILVDCWSRTQSPKPKAANNAMGRVCYLETRSDLMRLGLRIRSLAADNAQRGPISHCRHCSSARDGLPRCPALLLTTRLLITLDLLARHAMDHEEKSHYSQWIRRKTSWMLV